MEENQGQEVESFEAGEGTALEIEKESVSETRKKMRESAAREAQEFSADTQKTFQRKEQQYGNTMTGEEMAVMHGLIKKVDVLLSKLEAEGSKIVSGETPQEKLPPPIPARRVIGKIPRETAEEAQRRVLGDLEERHGPAEYDPTAPAEKMKKPSKAVPPPPPGHPDRAAWEAKRQKEAVAVRPEATTTRRPSGEMLARMKTSYDKMLAREAELESQIALAEEVAKGETSADDLNAEQKKWIDPTEIELAREELGNNKESMALLKRQMGESSEDQDEETIEEKEVSTQEDALKPAPNEPREKPSEELERRVDTADNSDAQAIEDELDVQEAEMPKVIEVPIGPQDKINEAAGEALEAIEAKESEQVVQTEPKAEEALTAETPQVIVVEAPEPEPVSESVAPPEWRAEEETEQEPEPDIKQAMKEEVDAEIFGRLMQDLDAHITKLEARGIDPRTLKGSNQLLKALNNAKILTQKQAIGIQQDVPRRNVLMSTFKKAMKKRNKKK